MRLLLDTNVLIDGFLAREPYYQDWLRILDLWICGRAELWASAKSFTDISYVCCKSNDSTVVQRAFVECFRYLNVCSIGGQDVLSAARLEWHDFEDCLAYQAALKIKADFIITRNAKDFARSSIPALVPSEFFDYLREHEHLVFEDDVLCLKTRYGAHSSQCTRRPAES